MLKKNIFQKKISKTFLSVTKRIESFFNFFKENFFYKKNFSRNIKTIDKKIFIIIATIFITIVSYFQIPAFYDKKEIKSQLENQILEQYNLKVNLDQSLRYGLFPKPHFYSKNTIITYNSEEIAKSINNKIFITLRNFFSQEDIRIKDLIFKKTDFKVNTVNFNFFINLLKSNKINKNINFFDSKLFYVDQNNDVIFLSNIKKLDYSYEDSLLKKLNSKFELFNIPINLNIENNIYEKKFFSELKSHSLRLHIKNESNYKKEFLDGLLELNIVNQSKKINYDLKNDTLNFSTNNKNLEGNIFIKPFFLSSIINLTSIDFKKLLKDDSIIINILKTEILNNKNLNAKITINADKIKAINFLNDISFSILLEQGNIFIQNLKIIFKDTIVINFSDAQLIIDNNTLNFAGYITFDFIDINNFYRHYQVNRKHRKDIKKIRFGYLFNFDEKYIEIDNLKVDGNTNQNLNNFLNTINSKKEDIFNKIVFRNTIKNFFKNF